MKMLLKSSLLLFFVLVAWPMSRAHAQSCVSLFEPSAKKSVLESLFTAALNPQVRDLNRTDINKVYNESGTPEGRVKMNAFADHIIKEVTSGKITNPWILSKILEIIKSCHWQTFAWPKSLNITQLLYSKMPLPLNYLEQALLNNTKLDVPTKEDLNSPDPSLRVMAETAEKLRTIDEQYAVLALHPGIQSRIDEFLIFARRVLHDQNLSAFELMHLYKKELGSTDYYRALLLSAEEANYVTNNGIHSNSIRTTGSQLTALQEASSVGHAALQKRHMYPEWAKVSSYMSVTTVAVVAEWVVKVPDNSPKARYLFKILVPRLDVVYIDKMESLVWNPNIPGHQIINRSGLEPSRIWIDFQDVMNEMR